MASASVALNPEPAQRVARHLHAQLALPVDRAAPCALSARRRAACVSLWVRTTRSTAGFASSARSTMSSEACGSELATITTRAVSTCARASVSALDGVAVDRRDPARPQQLDLVGAGA